MPIPVTCQCGQSFAAGDHLAGRTVQCPKCQRPLTIPAPQAPAQAQPLGVNPGASSGSPSIFDQAGMKSFTPGKPQCPGCGAELLPNAVLCTKCGYHLQLGRRIGNQTAAASGGHDAHGVLAADALSRAAARIDEEKANSKKEYTQGMPWWALAGIFLFAITFLGAMLYLPGDQALAGGGFTIAIVCGIIQLYHSIRILMIAFNDNVGHGLACLFVPCYAFIYSIMHWDECGSHFAWSFCMGLIGNLVGGGMVAVAPYAKPNIDGKTFAPPAPQTIKLVMKTDELPSSILRVHAISSI